MKEELKPLYDYQWELTLAAAQLDEKILRCPCNSKIESAVRGHCRSLIMTASDIKYELISLEQNLLENSSELIPQTVKDELFTGALQQMERSLYLAVKNYVNLMASLEGQKEAQEAMEVLKEFWPKMAEIYQYFKTSLLKAEEENF